MLSRSGVFQIGLRVSIGMVEIAFLKAALQDSGCNCGLNPPVSNNDRAI